MRRVLAILVVCCVLLGAVVHAQDENVHHKHHHHHKRTRTAPEPRTEEEKLGDMISNMERTLALIGRQIMMQRFYQEEAARSGEASGIKRVRALSRETTSYIADDMMMTMHNHPDTRRSIGLGEMDIVLNGVDFRTAHTDYELKRRSTKTQNYGETEPIDFPEVPPEVSKLTSVDEQVGEMREWFKAWHQQDYKKRDYRKYFKPVMCYLEGTWTTAQQDDQAQPFPTDNRQMDDMSWQQLADKIRFSEYSGRDDNSYSFAHLPSTVMSMLNDTTPQLAQWNYDVLCHPISFDLPLNRLRPIDDLKARMGLDGRTMEDYEASRAARYQMAVQDSDRWIDSNKKWALLDRIMSEVPGRDNYGAFINDTVFDVTAFPIYDKKSTEPLNTAYYHRWYDARKNGALGRQDRHRGFSDENIFMAQTSDPAVAGMNVERCKGGLSKHLKEEHCRRWHQKWTYAVPLEIIYLTPLHRWNPLGVQDYGSNAVEQAPGRPEICHGQPAWQGVNDQMTYLTPDDFYETDALDKPDPADSGTQARCVLGRDDHFHHMYPSGIWVHTPAIPGIGPVRQRYPIMPVAGEGSGVWKELDALKDIVLEPSKHQQLYKEPSQQCGGP